jgi:hypothetical protein
MKWRSQGSPSHKKSGSKVSGKVMVTFFYGIRKRFVPPDQTANKEY